jgi:hypothetical protein
VRQVCANAGATTASPEWSWPPWLLDPRFQHPLRYPTSLTARSVTARPSEKYGHPRVAPHVAVPARSERCLSCDPLWIAIMRSWLSPAAQDRAPGSGLYYSFLPLLSRMGWTFFSSSSLLICALVASHR